MIRQYYRLAKPGIVYGNLLPAVAAFFFGSTGSIEWLGLCAMAAGLAGIIACGCVLNNYFDRHIDARMERTQRRALPSGTIAPAHAILFGLLLGLVGGTLLFFYTNTFALGAALLGLVVYVAFYTPLKHHNAAALYVGAVAGAMPPVVGYTAASGALDGYALALFAVLYVWQLPHFIAIAFFRYDEYKAAGVPLYVKKSPSPETKKLARKIFGYSLWVLLLGSLGLILHTWIR